jgi:predicted RNA-binding Zn-ribbon protein involved in translation (DUF1610 family)
MDLLGDIWDILKSLKHRRPSKAYCPKCASPNIHLSKGSDYCLIPMKYVCENCGYTGPIVMELEKKESKRELS